MSQVEVTVRGRYSAFQPPERGTVHLTVTLEGPKEPSVHGGVAEAVGAVTERVRPLHDPAAGPVTWWASDQLRTWARRPWNSEGKQLPLVFHASADVRVKFADFSVLSRWLAEVLQVRGVRVNRIEWALTEARKTELTHRVRAQAVADARQKAQAYADALGLGAVTAVAVADAGMLGQGLEPSNGAPPVAFARAGAASGGAAEVAFAPEDVEVSAAVDARFLAG
ncbi:SIMPL domain-containing protein [Desertihabitans brevis]|uniref:SIMPL domain-containing protein n=1 Tax=Desertihabitans brevis TaxID=2268447 RepID=A0A367YWV3_9ACTN|nr:SIMPL domain-containing protein [Desertihabitans brevis]RCK70217.1 SIMPL domain-containing protein [Desertihabitans brevis]